METKHTPTPWTLNPRDVENANAAFIVEACNSYDALKARNAELVQALNAAIETIKIWHGFDEPKDMREAAWQIYLKHSPEMKRITAALANEKDKADG